MRQLLIKSDGSRFVDPFGRHVVLRGVNLGGDCKLPFPDGATHLPSDFSNHREVSFVGRPFPIRDADEHFARICRWGFNSIRLLVTWEAVEHAGPGQYDEAYLDYIAAIARSAASHGLVAFVDFHQDVWSRMTGGDGAPGWVFDKVGLDFRRFDAADAAHVMQYRYDHGSMQARQEDRYPTMSWSRNYRLPVNGIMWSAFFAGALITPAWKVGGENVQNYLQRHYLGAISKLAERLKDIDSVIGFDTLNEPSPGWIGQAMSAPQIVASRDAPIPVRAGPCWTPFLALRAASGETVTLPLLVNGSNGALEFSGTHTANHSGVSIWQEGICDPFEEAGAWTRTGGVTRVLDEDFFRVANGARIDPDADLMRPFFHEVASAIRSVRSDWLLFAEVNPYQFAHGRRFPTGMPERSVNASHWYDVEILWRKSFDASISRDKLRARYIDELAAIHSPDAIEGGAPSLVGEFGVPYDLDDGLAFARWAGGERSEDIWAAHARALGIMYDALDALLLSSAQWNYTATNRNDLRIGDGWNQEDLSVYSPDQASDGGDGGRARLGFSRPYVERAQGRIVSMQFDSEKALFNAEIDVDSGILAPTEIFIPSTYYPHTLAATATPGATLVFDPIDRRLRVTASRSGRLLITVEPGNAASTYDKGDKRLNMRFDRLWVSRIDAPNASNLRGERVE